MFSMIVELIDKMSQPRREGLWKRIPQDSLSRSRYISGSISSRNGPEEEGCTPAMDPQKGLGQFPFTEKFALCEPLGGSTIISFANIVVLYRWIWGRQPTSKLVLQLDT
jgi:hypothetical protein